MTTRSNVPVTHTPSRMISKLRSRQTSARAAVVYDFNAARITREPDVAAAVSRHAPQLNLYRRVAGVLTSLPPERIRGELVLTQVQRRVDVPAALRS